MIVQLTAAELEDVASLLRFASDTDKHFANVAAFLHGGTVVWVATDNRRLATIARGSCDTEQGQFAVPTRELSIVNGLSRTRPSDPVELRMTDGGGELALPGFVLPFASRPQRILETYNAATQLKAPDRSIKVARADLVAVVHAAALTPPFLPDSARKYFSLAAHANTGTLEATAVWVGHRDTTAMVACQANGDVIIAIDPSILFDLIAVADQDQLELQAGATGDAPVRLGTASGLSALVMPGRSMLESLRPHFEGIFAEILDIHPGQLQRDDEGDYPLRLRNGGWAFVRLEAADAAARVPHRIRIFTSLAADIDPNAEALAEINSQNQRCRFGRMYLWNRNLYLEMDLTLEEVSTPQLQSAIETVANLADEVGPLMQAFFGKSAPRD